MTSSRLGAADEGLLPVDEVALLDEDTEDLFEEAPCGYLTMRLDGTILRVDRTFLG